jgi:hypothetical protein
MGIPQWDAIRNHLLDKAATDAYGTVYGRGVDGQHIQYPVAVAKVNKKPSIEGYSETVL